MSDEVAASPDGAAAPMRMTGSEVIAWPGAIPADRLTCGPMSVSSPDADPPLAEHRPGREGDDAAGAHGPEPTAPLVVGRHGARRR